MITPSRAGLLLCLCLAPFTVQAAAPDAWIPARWDGGPLEAARRAKDKKPPKPEVSKAISRWYDPGTLGLLEGMPVNCLLLTFSGAAGPSIEKEQQQLVTAYARRARARGLAVLGLVHPGPQIAALAAAAAAAQLDGLVLEGDFPGGLAYAEGLQKALRARKSSALVIPLAAPASLRQGNWPVVAVEGVTPNVGKAEEGAAIASATGGMWLDSNLWVVRSFRAPAPKQIVWVSHPASDSPGIYAKSIADASAAGGRWIISLDDELRLKLLARDPAALAVWRGIGATVKFFESHAEWRGQAPFGNLAIVLDPAGPNLANSEEYLNLVARRQIPYRVILRSQLTAASLAGMRAALAFDLAPPTDAERRILRDFAAQGGLVLSGPSWGGAPKDQTYTMAAVEQGEVAVYKEEAPDPQTVARDLNDLITTPDLGLSVMNAPSVLSYVSAEENRILIQLVNYATHPAPPLTIWITGKFSSARMHAVQSGPTELPVKRSGDHTEITVSGLADYAAVIVE